MDLGLTLFALAYAMHHEIVQLAKNFQQDILSKLV